MFFRVVLRCEIWLRIVRLASAYTCFVIIDEHPRASWCRTRKNASKDLASPVVELTRLDKLCQAGFVVKL